MLLLEVVVVAVEVVLVVVEAVDTTGITGTMVLLLMKTDMVEDTTDALKKEMELDVVGLLVDTVVGAVEATAMVIQVTLNAQEGTLSVTVELVMGKLAS